MKWTDDEIDYLKKNYGKETAYFIGKVISKSTASIYHKAKRLGLKSTLQRHKRNES